MSSRAAALAAAAALVAGAGAMTQGPSEPPAVAHMLERADAPRTAFGEGVVDVRVVVNEGGKKPSESRMELYLAGTDRSLIVMREGKQKGRKILTVGDRVWLIVPGASRPIPVSKSQRLMGAASFGDVARLRFADTYEAALRPADEAVVGKDGETTCRVLDLTAAHPGAAYPTAVLWLGRDDGLPRQLRLALASGKAAKEVRYSSYDSARRITQMEIRDLLAGGHGSVTALTFGPYEKRTLDPQLFDPESARLAP